MIGTLAAVAAKQGYDVVVSTGDKDLAQLVNAQVTLVNTMSNERLDPAGVLAKFGVAPERIIDYLTLVGDTVDNIPGVEKVGPKTAAKWIAEHGSLEGVIAAAATMKGAAGENLRKALDWLPQGRQLITVATDCDLSDHVPGWPAFESLAFAPVEAERLIAFYDHYDFKSFKRELESAAGRPAPIGPTAAEPQGLAVEKRYETVLTPAQLAVWIAKIEAAALTAIDTETDSLDPMRARIVGISLATQVGEAAYIPLRHSYAGAPDQLPFDEVLAVLRPWLENPAALKLGQNVKYDTHVFANAGIAVQGYVHDTLLQSYVLEAHRPHSLESLADRHLGRKGLSYEDLCGKGAHQIPFAQVAVDKATTYSGEDSEMCLHLHGVLWPQIEADAGLKRIYADIEMPTADLLARVERQGVLIAPEKLKLQSHEIGQRLVLLEQQCYDIAGQPFNIGSPKQIGEILFLSLIHI